MKYDGTEIDPVEFLKMLFGNMKMSGTDSGMPDFETLDMDIPTDYDENMEEIEGLMARFYPEYLMEEAGGPYTVPDKTEHSLRKIFSLSAAGSRCAVLTASGLSVYDETLTLCASAETQDDASAAILLDDGAAVLIGGGIGRLWLPG